MPSAATAIPVLLAARTCVPPLGLGALVADAGTVLMHGTCLFLIAGGLLIGRFEGFLLSRSFGLDAKRAARWMIGANYASAFVGLFAIRGLHELLCRTVFTDAPLYTIRSKYYVLLAASFLLSVSVEWPFCARAFDRERRHWKRTLRASLLAQAASYLLLLPLYVWLADYNVITALTPDRTLRHVPPDLRARVYYIAVDDGDVYSVRIDGRDRRHEYALDHSLRADKVYGAPEDAGKGYGLWVLYDQADDDPVKLGSLAGVSGLPACVVEGEDFHECARNRFCIWDLRPSKERYWHVNVVPYGGTSVVGRRGGETIVLRYETTYDRWLLQCVSAVREGLIVFEAAEQILVADLDRREVGVLARGHGPCVMIEADTSIATAASR
jgi:hypothetical protein